MSIMCCIYVPEGIVMAADSRLTRTKMTNSIDIPAKDGVPAKTVWLGLCIAAAGGGCAAWFLPPSQSCRVDDCRSAAVPPENLQPSPMSIQRAVYLPGRGGYGF